MDNSFDERCETDISDCFEDILEGEEEVFFGFYLGNLIMKVIHYAVCSPTNAFFFFFFFFFKTNSRQLWASQPEKITGFRLLTRTLHIYMSYYGKSMAQVKKKIC